MKCLSETVESNDVCPANLDAERCLLSSVLMMPEAFDELDGLVADAMFHGPQHAAIWRALKVLDPSARGSAVLLADQLQRAGELADAGGFSYLAEVVEAVPHGLHAQHYARVVVGNWQRREIQYATRTAAKSADDLSRTPEDVAAEVIARAEAIIEPTLARSTVRIGDALASHFRAIQEGRQTGPATGFRDIDETLDGLPHAGLTIVAARPGVGKTALAGGIAVNLARAGIGVQFFSLEQPAEQLAERALCGMGSVPAWAIRHSERADSVTRERIAFESSRVAELPFWIDDTPGRTVSQIVTATRAAKRKHGIGAVIVDYLGLITSDDKRANREQQVAGMTRALRTMARELEIPVLLLSQLNRMSESRPGRLPMLSDLRESGAIEQDADQVILLHRPAASDSNADKTEAHAIIAKNRGGSTGSVRLHWQGDQMTFRDAAESFEEFRDAGQEAFT